MTETEKRLTELELHFMKLERFTNELSSVVAEQQKTIDQLVVEVQRLAASPEPGHEKPPHY